MVNLEVAQDVVKLFNGRLQALDQPLKFPHKVAFDFGAAGVVAVDGRTGPLVVSEGGGDDADTRATIDLQSFQSLVSGKAAAPALMLKGKLKVKGNIAHLVKLRNVIASEA